MDLDLLRRPSARRAAGAVVAAVLALGACSKSSPPTQEAYVKAADGICEETAEELEELELDLFEELGALREEGESNPNVERWERWMRINIVPEYRDMDRRLRGIRPPDGDSTYLADLYDDLAIRITELNARPSQGRDLVRDDEELRRRFASYGMEVCGTV